MSLVGRNHPLAARHITHCTPVRLRAGPGFPDRTQNHFGYVPDTKKWRAFRTTTLTGSSLGYCRWCKEVATTWDFLRQIGN